MYTKILKLIGILYKFYKFKIFYLQFLIILNSLAQILSILLFAPFIMIISKTSNLETYINKYKILSQFDYQDLLIFTTCSVTIIFILSNILSIYVSNLMIKFCQNINIDFSNNIFSGLLYKDYEFHLKNQSSELISKLTLEVSRVVVNIINPLIQLNSKIITIVFILSGLILYNGINSVVSIIAVIILIYYLFFYSYKNQLKKNSQLISDNLTLRQKTIKESLQNIKETKLFQLEKFFIKNFNLSNSLIAHSVAKNQYLSIIPKYIVEIIGIILLMIYVFFKIQIGKSLYEILPGLSVYLIAGYKLLPAIQGVATSYASIKGNHSAIDKIIDDINFNQISHNFENKKNFLNLNKINVKNLSFNYNNESQILHNISLSVNKGQMIGVVGGTGVGKSTLINLIVGLLKPTNGSIEYNDKNINEDYRNEIIKNIGYIPQKIYLIEGSILNNIAVGINQSKIDYKKIERVCKISQIHQFISGLKNGLDTMVGENGILLSGGQIQRIGFARALYKNPSILIIDEGTYGLDDITENKLMNSLKEINENMCIIIITHKKELLKYCNKVYEIKNKSINEIN